MAELHLCSPLGFRAAGVAAGIKSKKDALDVGMIVTDTVATAAAVFTTNKVFAAPVKVGREHVARGKLHGVIVNAGNANACTGKQGEKDARMMCRLAGLAIGCEPALILPSSTGIIGHRLPMDKLERGIAHAGHSLGRDREHALRFAGAILTTDLKRKSAATSFKLGRQTVTLAGVCKGSGMIGPKMAAPHATMLAYLTTDAAIPSTLLRKLLSAAADSSFNAVTVDDHTSTNDTAVILASGASGAKIDSPRATRLFRAALKDVCESLAYQIAADGEGATKVVKILVKGAASELAAGAIARAIANSPLVKCAMHGNDPNWGRIVSAAGYAGVPFDPDRCILTLQETAVFRAGRPLPFDAGKLSRMLAAKEVEIVLECRLGQSQAMVWTCDLSKEYVTINAEYHT
ncbi:MAG TPA: bifunctional glutamate N-acetyltransferase/amino-acid acetyltransferase ArgJ [Tepidisphaeraceae bacterium]|nr:bifunctional glutamate N-acetyltransferase/amino-acid acetyltransferase ArgJ [Tepidisphaeraceae bacterium]